MTNQVYSHPKWMSFRTKPHRLSRTILNTLKVQTGFCKQNEYFGGILVSQCADWGNVFWAHQGMGLHYYSAGVGGAIEWAYTFISSVAADVLARIFGAKQLLSKPFKSRIPMYMGLELCPQCFWSFGWVTVWSVNVLVYRLCGTLRLSMFHSDDIVVRRRFSMLTFWNFDVLVCRYFDCWQVCFCASGPFIQWVDSSWYHSNDLSSNSDLYISHILILN